MKRPSSSDLVLENGEVKLRLKAERLESSDLIHIDWVRFTVPTRFAPVPTVETLFPTFDPAIFSDGGPLDTRTEHERDEGKRMALYHRVKLVNMLREFEDQDYAAHTQAFQLAEDVADILGPGFIASSEVCKGKDFYRFRFNIERYGQPVGWVDYCSKNSGSSVCGALDPTKKPGTGTGGGSGSGSGSGSCEGTDCVDNDGPTLPGKPAFGKFGAPAQPKLYTTKYPDGIAGVWSAKTAEIKSAPISNLVGDLMPKVVDGGTPPTWIIDLDMGAIGNFGQRDISPPSWLWGVLKAITILSALLLARRLVFGG